MHPLKQVLLITATAGMGKTSCALWLVRQPRRLGRVWLFLSLPSVRDPFAPQGLVRHLQQTFGFQEREMNALRRCPLVLVLDSLDEVPRTYATWAHWCWHRVCLLSDLMRKRSNTY